MTHLPMETIYNFLNVLVLPFWLLMLFAPHWVWTKRIMTSFWPIVLVALLYAGLLLSQIGGMAGLLANPTLTGIAEGLGNPTGATIGWAHFLAFDLFVGRWAYLDSRENKITAWIASPLLAFIFMVGPLGFLLYLGGRTAVLTQRKTG
jgi:hypothetical protein